jgi:hypothetical protein
MINRNRLAESFMQADHPQRRYLLFHACQLDTRHFVRAGCHTPDGRMVTAGRAGSPRLGG